MSTSKETIFVTGGAGFIGSHFCDLALDYGHRVVCLDNLSYAGTLDNLAAAKTHQDFTFIKGDICDFSAVTDLLTSHQPDWIVNFAAESHVDNSITGPEIFIDTNIKGTFTMLQASLNAYQARNKPENFRYLQISTDEVFGSLGSNGAFTEDSPYQPNSPYSASKAAADHLVRAWHVTYGLPVLTTHCSNNFGPRQHLEKFIPVIIRACLEGRPIPVYGKGTNVRDWLSVTDHCTGIYLTLQKGRPGQNYAFGGGVELSNLDLAYKICRLMDEKNPAGKPHEGLISFTQDRLGHDFRYAIDCTKAKEALGYSPNTDLDRQLGETLDWYITQFEEQKNKERKVRA